MRMHLDIDNDIRNLAKSITDDQLGRLFRLTLDNQQVVEEEINDMLDIFKSKVVYIDEPKGVSNEDIEEVYAAYPSRCVVKGSPTGKSSKDKKRIEKLLKNKSKDELIETIEKYKNDCRKHKIYMKNFSTFLNNIPDYGDELKQSKKESWNAEPAKVEIKWQQ